MLLLAVVSKMINHNLLGLLLNILLYSSFNGYVVTGFPDGAPAAACTTLSPDPVLHGAPPQTSIPPYEIDLSPFSDGNGGFEYVPGIFYPCKYRSE